MYKLKVYASPCYEMHLSMCYVASISTWTMYSAALELYSDDFMGESGCLHILLNAISQEENSCAG